MGLSLLTNQRQNGAGLFKKSSMVHKNIAVYETLTSFIYSQVPYNVHQFAYRHKYTRVQRTCSFSAFMHDTAAEDL